MQILKYIILFVIFISSSGIGILYSKKYINREKELKEIKNALTIFKTKLLYTYETIPEIFKEIAQKVNAPICSIFKMASDNMQEILASDAWIEAIDKSDNNLNKEDKRIIKDFSKLLGQTDVEGQISSVELVINFLDKQIEEAIIERKKSEKLYRTLGMTFGLGLVILLI